jgi:hypothetical protein
MPNANPNIKGKRGQANKQTIKSGTLVVVVDLVLVPAVVRLNVPLSQQVLSAESHCQLQTQEAI